MKKSINKILAFITRFWRSEKRTDVFDSENVAEGIIEEVKDEEVEIEFKEGSIKAPTEDELRFLKNNLSHAFSGGELPNVHEQRVNFLEHERNIPHRFGEASNLSGAIERVEGLNENESSTPVSEIIKNSIPIDLEDDRETKMDSEKALLMADKEELKIIQNSTSEEIKNKIWIDPKKEDIAEEKSSKNSPIWLK